MTKHDLAIQQLASGLPERLRMFLDPAAATRPAMRSLYPNFKVRAACPVYQRGVYETTTVDVGDHQVRAVILQPSLSAPVLLSGSSLANVSSTLFKATLSRGGRLVDTTPGIYAGNQRMPIYRSFEIPSDCTFSINASIGIPIHGGFYTPALVAATTAANTQTQHMFRDFTEVLNGGVDTGVRGIPVNGTNDAVDLYLSFRSTVAYTNGDLIMRLGTCTSAGVITYTSFNMVGASSATGGTNVAGGSITCPAGAVAITSLEVVSSVARGFAFTGVHVNHSVGASTAVDVSVGLGSFTGSPVSGLPSFLAVCQAARVTAASVLITNTSSALNANGFITGAGMQNISPSAAGIYGENSVASVTTAKTTTLVDGAYAALTPDVDLDYTPIDSLPALDSNRAIFFIQSQDNTPITLKIEYQLVVEVLSQNPIFPPEEARSDLATVTALQGLSHGGYLLMCENKLHLSAIANLLRKIVPIVRRGLEVGAMMTASARPEVSMGLKAASAGAGNVQSLVEMAAKAEKAVQSTKRKNL